MDRKGIPVQTQLACQPRGWSIKLKESWFVIRRIRDNKFLAKSKNASEAFRLADIAERRQS